MGGCASMDKMKSKLKDIPWLREKKTYKVQDTKIAVVEGDVSKGYGDNIVIPVQDGGVVDSSFLGLNQEQQAKFNAEAQSYVNGPNMDVLRSGKPFYVGLDKSKIPKDSVFSGVKTLIFVPIPRHPNIARDVLPTILMNIVRTADEAKLKEVAIPRLIRPGLIGANDSEIAYSTAYSLQKRFSRPLNVGDHSISKVDLISEDARYNEEMMRALTDAIDEKKPLPDFLATSQNRSTLMTTTSTTQYVGKSRTIEQNNNQPNIVSSYMPF